MTQRINVLKSEHIRRNFIRNKNIRVVATITLVLAMVTMLSITSLASSGYSNERYATVIGTFIVG